MLLDDGGLARHVGRVQDQVRSNPMAADLRVQLFQLVAIQGNWEKARAQLQMGAKLDLRAQPQAMLYLAALEAEVRREAVFAGIAEPEFPRDYSPAMANLVDALRTRSYRSELNASAERDFVDSCGRILCDNDAATTFRALRDGDDRLGAVCEMIIGQKYCWVPFAALRSLRILPPSGLADLIWAQAEVVFADGERLACLLPARYPLRPHDLPHEWDDLLKFGRRTEWVPMVGGGFRGIGQKMWFADNGEWALLDMRVVEMH